LLDLFSGRDIRRTKAWWDGALKFYSDYYSDLAQQRAVVSDKIKEALQGASKHKLPFKYWKRYVGWRWSAQPLSSVGSLLSDPGGRFNIGDIDPARFPQFPSLYLAADTKTAIEEATQPAAQTKDGLTPLELSLTSKESFSIVGVSGFLESIIDLDDKKALRPFIDIINRFSIAPHLISTAKKLGLPKPELIVDVDKLVQALLLPGWKADPITFDVPSASQIFGRLVMDAGIDGILFPSKYTERSCLAIFPHCLMNSSSWVELDETKPPFKSVIKRLDSTSWKSLSTP
jgi:hypothetical protein